MLGQSNVITARMFLQIRSHLMSLTPPITCGDTDGARSHMRSSNYSSLFYPAVLLLNTGGQDYI